MKTENVDAKSALEKITIENRQLLETLSTNLVNLRNKLETIMPKPEDESMSKEKVEAERNGKKPYIDVLKDQVEKLRGCNRHLEDTIDHLNDIA